MKFIKAAFSLVKHERDKKLNAKRQISWSEKKNWTTQSKTEEEKKKNQNYMFMQTIQFVRIIVIYTFLYTFGYGS